MNTEAWRYILVLWPIAAFMIVSAYSLTFGTACLSPNFTLYRTFNCAIHNKTAWQDLLFMVAMAIFAFGWVGLTHSILPKDADDQPKVATVK